MNEDELEILKNAAYILDEHDHEILAEQIWYVFEKHGGER